MNKNFNMENNNVQDDVAVVDIKDDLILSDQKEALNALSMDEKFIESLVSQKTLKDMQRLFNNRGVILSEEEIDSFIEMVKASSSNKSLPDEFFEDASAGVLNNQGMYSLVNNTVDLINDSKESKKISGSVFWI